MTKKYFLNLQSEDKLQWKTTSKYEMWNISATTHWIILTLSFKDQTIFFPSNKDDLHWKATSKERRPQNIEREIYQQSY